MEYGLSWCDSLWFGLWHFIQIQSRTVWVPTKSCLATSLTWPSLTGPKCISIYLIFLFFFFVAVIGFFSSSLAFVRGCQIANNGTLPFLKWPQFLKIQQSLTGPNVLAYLSHFSSPFTSSSRCCCLFSSSFFKFIRGCQINNIWPRPEPFFLGCIRCFLH